MADAFSAGVSWEQPPPFLALSRRANCCPTGPRLSIAALATVAACSLNAAVPGDTAEPQDASVDSAFDSGSDATPEALFDTAQMDAGSDVTADSAVNAGSTNGAGGATDSGSVDDGGDKRGSEVTAQDAAAQDATVGYAEGSPAESAPFEDATPEDAIGTTVIANGGGLDVQDGGIAAGGGSALVDCSPDAGRSIGASGAPALLACTGLYSDWPSRTIAASAVPYDPGLHLWSDGAVKNRYIALPSGTRIDTSNMDEWTFPVGTKVWKEFVLGGVKIETRYLFKQVNGSWAYTTYQWSTDQTTATELTAGATNVNGTSYEIPNLEKCRVCHNGRLDFILGFEAISLSSPLAMGLPMATLVADGLLTSPPATPLTIPGDATASAALGWLHANCGTACHNSSHYALAGPTGFFMRLEAAKLSSVQATDTYLTGVNITATFKEPDGGSILRIAPRDPTDSCVVFRAGYRDTHGEKIQMPPDDTHVVDSADLDVVKSWIGSL
jgi:hypothetical protein